MSDPSNSASIESLLEHGGYLRALARKLTLDDERAEDLVQQVWLTVLERRALPTGSPRAWLHVVLRNLAFRSRSRELERPERERWAARPESQELTADADLDARQLVIEVLRGLRQPYRQTLYLRYVRDMSPTEIARHEDLPVSTVKTQLQRGLAQMREELDRRSEGDWRAWCVPLLGLAELQDSGALALLRWRLRSSIGLQLGVAAGLAGCAALIALIATLALRASAPDAPSKPIAVAALTPAPSAAPIPEGSIPADRVPESPAPRIAQAEPDMSAPGLSGRVLNPDGEPLAGARVRLAPRTGTLVTQRVRGIAAGGGAGELHDDLRVRWTAEERSVLSDANGHFELRGADLVDRRLTVAAEGAARLERRLPAELALPHDLGDLRLDPPVIVAGRVLDPTGEPVIGARFWAPVIEEIGDQRYVLHAAGGELLGTSATDGSFRLEDLPAGAWSFSLETDEAALMRVQGDSALAGREVQGLVLTTMDSATIRGRLTGIPDSMQHRLLVIATAVQQSEPARTGEVVHQDTSSRSSEVDPDGRFELRGLWKGASYNLQAQPADSTSSALPCSATVRAEAGAAEVELAFEEAPSVSLRLVDKRAGAAVSDAQVAVLIDEDGLSGVSMGRSDEHGVCRLATGGAVRGRLFVEHADYAPLDLAEVELARKLEFALEPEALLAVRVLDPAEQPVPGRLVVVSRVEDGRSRRARSDARGRVLLGGLNAGDHEVATLDPNREREADGSEQGFLIPLAPSMPARTVRLRAGEREELVLRVDPAAEAQPASGPSASLGGRLTDEEGAPLRGARVRLQDAAEWEERALQRPGTWEWERDLAELNEDEPRRTDADGRFALPRVPAGRALLLALDAPGYARRIVAIAPLAVDEARLDLQVRTTPGSELHMLVEGVGERVLFARLLTAESGGYALPLSLLLDEEGELRFTDLPAGNWRVELLEVDERRGHAPLPSVWSGEFTLGAGELRELRVDLR